MTINLDNLDGTNFDLTGYTVKSQLAKTYASSTKTISLVLTSRFFMPDGDIKKPLVLSFICKRNPYSCVVKGVKWAIW